MAGLRWKVVRAGALDGAARHRADGCRNAWDVASGRSSRAGASSAVRHTAVSALGGRKSDERGFRLHRRAVPNLLRWHSRGLPERGRSTSAAPAGYDGSPLVAKTNGLAVASLICSCFGVVLFTLPCIVGVIFGFIARSQIARSEGKQKGEGLALAGIIVGFAGIALVAIIVIVRVAHHNNSGVIVGSLGPAIALLGR